MRCETHPGTIKPRSMIERVTVWRRAVFLPNAIRFSSLLFNITQRRAGPRARACVRPRVRVCGCGHRPLSLLHVVLASRRHLDLSARPSTRSTDRPIAYPPSRPIACRLRGGALTKPTMKNILTHVPGPH